MAQNNNAPEQDINQLLKVRREKLQDLQDNGKDPFQITKYDVTHHSQEIKDNYDTLEGKTVSIAGRMMFKRVIFLSESTDYNFSTSLKQFNCFNGVPKGRTLITPFPLPP